MVSFKVNVLWNDMICILFTQGIAKLRAFKVRGPKKSSKLPACIGLKDWTKKVGESEKLKTG